MRWGLVLGMVLAACGNDDDDEKNRTVCTAEYAPVCGTDGKIYSNRCLADEAGVALSATACTAPSGTFACGGLFCAVSSTYCRRTPSAATGLSDSFQCVDAPAACASSHTCACHASDACGMTCAADAQGNLTLTCPAR